MTSFYAVSALSASDRFHMSPTDRGHVAKASPTVTIIWDMETRLKTAFTRCRHSLKTVKNVTDRPPVHTKTAHFLRADLENGRF